jgi:hypothetical protein
VFSAVIAFSVSLPLSYALYIDHIDRISCRTASPVLQFASQCKWLLASSILAIAIAFACDNRFGAEEEPWWQRWAEGAGIAALLGLARYLVVLWLEADRAALYTGGPTALHWRSHAFAVDAGGPDRGDWRGVWVDCPALVPGHRAPRAHGRGFSTRGYDPADR